MTDNEIIKALECCGKPIEEDCKSCPYTEGDDVYCFVKLKLDALNLINRQKAEIEKLERNELKEAMTFNSDTIKRASNEAIKEFAKKLKERIGDLHFQNYGIAILEINNLVNEMKGELKDE